MQYPHWLMVAGSVLVVLGFVGLIFRRNRKAKADREPTEMKGNGAIPLGLMPGAATIRRPRMS